MLPKDGALTEMMIAKINTELTENSGCFLAWDSLLAQQNIKYNLHLCLTEGLLYTQHLCLPSFYLNRMLFRSLLEDGRKTSERKGVKNENKLKTREEKKKSNKLTTKQPQTRRYAK